ncbi:hypothetical protein GGP41_002260 [Bipolaris sorokiniana]|uniref:Uncharacterized protein n=1 Tax=Cochliobolus sativus TaxID=45130 RepID=A0A8H5Z911_COCSA|nr:hypothetical protein GGP41_002260 [Bipolaris sorokiniana]
MQRAVLRSQQSSLTLLGLFLQPQNSSLILQVGRPSLLHIACALEILPWIKAVLAEKSWMP